MLLDNRNNTPKENGRFQKMASVLYVKRELRPRLGQEKVVFESLEMYGISIFWTG
jgi:hypothetical protein